MSILNRLLRLIRRKRGSELCPGAAWTLTAKSGVLISEEARLLAESLRDFPEDWVWPRPGMHALQHVPSGFELWVANGKEALSEWKNGGRIGEYTEDEQDLIWPHVEAFKKRTLTRFTGRPAKPRLHMRPSDGTWFCLEHGHPWVGVGKDAANAYESWQRAVSSERRKNLKPDEFLHVWSGHK